MHEPNNSSFPMFSLLPYTLTYHKRKKKDTLRRGSWTGSTSVMAKNVSLDGSHGRRAQRCRCRLGHCGSSKACEHRQCACVAVWTSGTAVWRFLWFHRTRWKNTTSHSVGQSACAPCSARVCLCMSVCVWVLGWSVSFPYFDYPWGVVGLGTRELVCANEGNSPL